MCISRYIYFPIKLLYKSALQTVKTSIKVSNLAICIYYQSSTIIIINNNKTEGGKTFYPLSTEKNAKAEKGEVTGP